MINERKIRSVLGYVLQWSLASFQRPIVLNRRVVNEQSVSH
jgi:hypothetical protein